MPATATLTPEQRRALQEVVAAKMRLWNLGDAAEALLGSDVATAGDELESLCCGLLTPEDAFDVSDDELIEAFSLHTCDDDCRSNGCPA